MAHVTRPPKARGNTTYVGEVSAGKPDIIDQEVDADFKTIYDVVNGGLDGSNILPGIGNTVAGIAYEQLSLAGKIQPRDLVSGFHFPTDVVFPPTSIDKTVLKVGASWWAIDSVVGPANVGFIATEVVVAELTYSSRGGLCFIIGSLEGSIFTQQAGEDYVHSRILIDGNPGAADGTEVANYVNPFGLVGPTYTGTLALVVPLSITQVAWNFTFGSFPPGTHRVKLTAQITPAGGTAFSQGVSNGSRLFVLEPS